MTDVKFMDLSQNDNPATTDSVLIGNSTNGLKRTTIGAIGNIFAVKGLFHFETLTVKTVPDPNATVGSPNHTFQSIQGITAPAVPGYTFAFWLSSAVYGSVYTNYLSNPMTNPTSVWLIVSDDNTEPIKVLVTAVYVKSTVA